MTEREEYEPGLLMIFRGFAGILFAIYTLDALVFGLHVLFRSPYEPHHFSHSRPGLAIDFIVYALLLVYLGWKPIRDQLGRAFLPIGLSIATIAPIVTDTMTAFGVFTTTRINEQVLLYSWESILALELLLPLILTAWQYRCSIVVFFCVGTATLDFVAMLLLLGRGYPYFLDLVKMISIRTLFFLIIGLVLNQLIFEQRKQRKALAAAYRELADYSLTQEKLAVSRERNRLARDFHDTLAHTLSSITVELEAVKTLLGSDLPQAERILARTQNAAREGLVETRRTLQALKPAPLEDLGLSLSVKRLAEQTAEINNLALDWRCTCPGENLPPEIERGFYRVAQEALTNAARHASATRLAVSLEKKGNGLRLEVGDDGRGFDVEEAAQKSGQTEHFGLPGMHERARLIGADLQILSTGGEGTRIVLTWEENHA